MNAHARNINAAAAALLVALMFVSMGTGGAQTWRWTYVAHAANNPLPPAESSVAISATTLHLAYTVPMKTGRIVIESCRAELRDVVDADAIEANGTKFLLVRFKPDHSAACASGRRPAVALPADDNREVGAVASAINRSCCAAARAAVAVRSAPPVSAAPAPSPTPVAAASAAPTAAPPALNARDWVESDGLFWFVRVRNDGGTTLTVRTTLFDCRNVVCRVPQPIRVGPGKTVTVASVAAAADGTNVSFAYRYVADSGSQSVAGAGSAAKRVPPGTGRMTAAELRTAQAAALAALRDAPPALDADPAPEASAPPGATATANAPDRPARLLVRGSSRLAIGQTGTALVRVIVGPNGTAQQATVVSSTNANLTAAAIETAVSSTYAPALRNGTPVAAKYVATFTFDGEDPSLAGIPVWKRGLPAPAPSPTPASGAAALGSAPPASGSGGAAAVEPVPPSATPEPAVPAAAPSAESAAPAPAADASAPPEHPAPSPSASTSPAPAAH